MRSFGIGSAARRRGAIELLIIRVHYGDLFHFVLMCVMSLELCGRTPLLLYLSPNGFPKCIYLGAGRCRHSTAPPSLPTRFALSHTIQIASGAGVNGPARIMDGIALKCDLHSSRLHSARANVITESFGDGGGERWWLPN